MYEILMTMGKYSYFILLKNNKKNKDNMISYYFLSKCDYNIKKLTVEYIFTSLIMTEYNSTHW